jgi:preprotein translocase subunit SecB
MDTQSAGQTGPVSPESPQIRVLSQYLKELSFRNQLGGVSGDAYDTPPQLDMGVEVKSRPVGANNEAWEADLHINLEARRGDVAMFSADVVYSGLFQFVNMRPEDVEPTLWIECPRLLFPFARAHLADVTREGGYPPVMINPIDFTPLYWDELRQRQERGDVPLQASGF